MSVSLYMDVHVPRPITRALKRRGVDLLTAQEDGTTLLPDDALLDRSTHLGRILFSQQDADLLAEAARRQRAAVPFAGVIYVPQLSLSIGECIDGCIKPYSADLSRSFDSVALAR